VKVATVIEPTPVAPAGDAATVRTEVLELFRACYPSPDGSDEPDATILATDPNALAIDPAPFYEALQARFRIADDPAAHPFGGFAGTVAHTIAQIADRWDGTLRD